MKKILLQNNYKSFSLKIIIFLLTVLLADFAIGSLLKRFYFEQKEGEDALTTYAIQDVKAQVLVLGSSRAVNIFDPTVFQSETGHSCFNAGRVGQSILYHYAILKSALSRYTPQVVILSVDAWDFAKEKEDYDRVSCLLPYYNDHPEIREVVHLRGPLEKFKMLSYIYPYNSLLLPIIKGICTTKKEKPTLHNGFVSINKVFDGPVRTIDFNVARKQLDSVKVKTYISLIELCKQKGINLFIVCPPYMVNAVGRNLSLSTARQLAEVYNVPYLDYAHDENYAGRPHLFADFKHLNEQGAREFSRFIAGVIGGGEGRNIGSN